MKKTKLIIFGTGIISDCVTAYFKNKKDIEIIAYCIDKQFRESDNFNGIPIINKEDILEEFSPKDIKIFVALGYHNLNRLREENFKYFKSIGFEFFSYIPDDLRNFPFKIGRNCLILPGAIIQPHSVIGDNVFIWNDALIGHHSKIGRNSWLTGGVTIGGLSEIGENCFLGLNASVGPSIGIGDNCILGANTLTTRNISSNSVVVQQDTPIHRLNSDQFLKITQAF
tara:strand:- start:1377 stop:2054 length:678 start_codon:yes stop_codon:yes gene_type:complete